MKPMYFIQKSLSIYEVAHIITILEILNKKWEIAVSLPKKYPPPARSIQHKIERGEPIEKEELEVVTKMIDYYYKHMVLQTRFNKMDRDKIVKKLKERG